MTTPVFIPVRKFNAFQHPFAREKANIQGLKYSSGLSKREPRSGDMLKIKGRRKETQDSGIFEPKTSSTQALSSAE